MGCNCFIIWSTKICFFALIPVITVVRFLLLGIFAFGMKSFGLVHSNQYALRKPTQQHATGGIYVIPDEKPKIDLNVVLVLTPGKQMTVYIYVVVNCFILFLSPLMPCFAECRTNLRGWLTVYLVYYILHVCFLVLLLIPLLMVAVENPFPETTAEGNYQVCFLLCLEILLVLLMISLGFRRKAQMLEQDEFEMEKQEKEMVLLRQREVVLPQQFWKNFYKYKM